MRRRYARVVSVLALSTCAEHWSTVGEDMHRDDLDAFFRSPGMPWAIGAARVGGKAAVRASDVISLARERWPDEPDVSAVVDDFVRAVGGDKLEESSLTLEIRRLARRAIGRSADDPAVPDWWYLLPPEFAAKSARFTKLPGWRS